MLLVDDRLINEIVNAPIEINLIPLGVGLMFLAVGYVAVLMWVTKDE